MSQKVKTVILDLRLLQTAAWYRGMGRYMAALLSELPGALPEDTRLIGVFLDDGAKARARAQEVKHIVPHIEILMLSLDPGGSLESQAANGNMLARWVSRNVKGSVAFVSTSIFSFDYSPFLLPGALNSVVIYDLIPYKLWNMFFRHFPRDEYFRRFKFIYEADHIIAISGEAKSDVSDLLGIDEGRVSNIGGAAIEAQHMGGLDRPEEEAWLMPELSKRRYILLPGGASPHKNMYRAAAGFDNFNKTFGDDFRLVIPSAYPDHMKTDLLSISPNIIFTGEVSAATLDEIYKKAEAIMFASLDEGLGLPILEAANLGKPIVCSDIAVFRELSEDLYFFDPLSVESMGQQLLTAILAVGEKTDFKKRYEDINHNFTWARSAKLFSKALFEAVPRSHSPAAAHDIVLEFNSSFETARLVGEQLDKFGYENAELWIDMLTEKLRPMHELPLPQRFFVHSRDIVTYPRSKKPATFIFTPGSAYTAYAALRTKGEILGEDPAIPGSVERLLDHTGYAKPKAAYVSSIAEQLRKV